MLNKNVFIVICEYSKFISEFSKKSNSEIISFDDIQNKLTSSDDTNSVPSNQIILFQIMRKINIFCKSKRMEFLYIHKNEISDDLIFDIKNAFSKEHKTNFYLLSNDPMSESLIANFDNISNL